MRFLARQGGTFPSSPLILASVVLSIIFFASLFQHEAVAGIGESAAQKARDSYQDVKQRIHLLSNNSNNYPPPVTIPPDDPAYLEPEWRFAKDISIVYTWVNGSDPAHLALKKQHVEVIDGERDRDNDDLRHSFRALNKFLPWHTGTIYLITPGQTPSWLDTSNPRIKIINQNDLLEPSEIPTFNSNCLESTFHKISSISSSKSSSSNSNLNSLNSLSEKFIVLNDDYFFGTLIHPSDFFTNPILINNNNNGNRGEGEYEYGIKMFLEPWSYGIAAKWRGDEQWPKSLRYTAKVIKDAYEEIFVEETRVTEHAPFVFDKRAFEGMHHRFNVHLRRNCMHKTRAPNDVIPPFLHHQYIIQEGSRCCGIKYEIVEGKSKFFEWTQDLKHNEEEFNKITKELKPKFFNINDKMGNGNNDNNEKEKIKKAQEQLKKMMKEWLPHPSEFEIIP